MNRRHMQAAVNLADALLLLDSVRKYGLVTGGAEVNVERCAQLIAKAKHRWDVHPNRDPIDTLAALGLFGALPLVNARPPDAGDGSSSLTDRQRVALGALLAGPVLDDEVADGRAALERRDAALAEHDKSTGAPSLPAAPAGGSSTGGDA